MFHEEFIDKAQAKNDREKDDGEEEEEKNRLTLDHCGIAQLFFLAINYGRNRELNSNFVLSDAKTGRPF